MSDPCFTETGRFRTKPATQDIPYRTEDGRRIREAYIASKGPVKHDYSELERRIVERIDNAQG